MNVLFPDPPVKRKQSLSEIAISHKKEKEYSSKKSSSKKEDKLTSQTGSGNRKARSSYSIAALCQMSVNIGGDPAAGVPDSLPGATGVNSPGMISLNSTESPRATPTPQSPMPPQNVPPTPAKPPLQPPAQV